MNKQFDLIFKYAFNCFPVTLRGLESIEMYKSVEFESIELAFDYIHTRIKDEILTKDSVFDVMTLDGETKIGEIEVRFCGKSRRPDVSIRNL